MTRNLAVLAFIGILISLSTLFFSEASFAKTQYAAVCTASHGLVAGWDGPLRDTYEEANKDAKNHLSKFGKGHDASVLEF